MKKPPEMRGLYLRGRTWWLVSCVDGRKQFRTLRTKDLRTAIQTANRLRRQPRQGHPSPLAGLLDRYLNEKTGNNQFSTRTVERARVAWRRLLDDTGAAELRELHGDVMRQWFAGLRRSGLRESSAQTYLAAVRSVFSWCVASGILPDNPAACVKVGRIDRGTRPLWVPAETRDMLIAKCDHPDVRKVLVLGFLCGLRIGEIVDARWGWVDVRNKALHVEGHEAWRPKDREPRTIPLSSVALAELGPAQDPRAYIVAPDVEKGRHRLRWDPRRPFSEHVRRCGCPHVTPHVMRHTFASLLVQRRVSIFKVSKWLGDGVVVVERHYAHLAATDSDIEALHD